jgi:hypothetical protein
MLENTLTPEQYEVLLKPLAANRVASRTQGGAKLSYLESWDVKAHLIRIFGFGGWSWQVDKADLVFEEKNEQQRWNVGYRVIGTLSVHALGYACYTEAAVGSSTQPQRGEAHDMAVKTAESDALKRCTINLGTQFGLSLYNDGSREDVVGRTLNPPKEAPVASVEPVSTLLDGEYALSMIAAVNAAISEQALKAIYEKAEADGSLDLEFDDGTGDRLRDMIIDRLTILREENS